MFLTHLGVVFTLVSRCLFKAKKLGESTVCTAYSAYAGFTAFTAYSAAPRAHAAVTASRKVLEV